MKIKKARKMAFQSMRYNYRLMWQDFCRLPARERVVLAWFLLFGISDLDRAVGTAKGTEQ
jgi:hypothetical protein